jgi:hypothetical protein
MASISETPAAVAGGFAGSIVGPEEVVRAAIVAEAIA